jgi:glycosyltransferase involved in cell wall biosynthesis
VAHLQLKEDRLIKINDVELVDVVVLTRNSERVLEKTLNSIFKEVPVNRVIIVDGYSTDDTLEIIEKFHKKYGNVILIRDSGTRGSARMKGIREVKTEWFLFVDSDVTLCDNWFRKIKDFVDDHVGAVWGTEIWDGIQNPVVLKLFLMLTRKIFETRGGTHDLLVRYAAVKDIDIPKNLHMFEDAFIKEWIAKKGYKIIATYDPYCLHHRPPTVWTFKGSVNLVADALKYGSLTKMPKYCLAYGFYTAYVVYRRLARNSIKESL